MRTPGLGSLWMGTSNHRGVQQWGGLSQAVSILSWGATQQSAEERPKGGGVTFILIFCQHRCPVFLRS